MPSYQRQASTAQDSLRSSDDPRASAVLHGRRRPAPQSQRSSNHDRSAKESPPLHQNTSQLQQSQRTKAQRGSVDTHSRNSNPNSISRGGKRQRGAEMLGDPRPARRRRMEPTSTAPLKDADYMRRTMRVPTIEDYPMLKHTFFANPKEQLHNALQGSGKFRTNFAGMGQDLFRCTVSCTFSSSEPAEVVTGEGRSKVLIFKVKDVQLLRGSRNLQRMLLLCIYWRVCMTPAIWRR